MSQGEQSGGPIEVELSGSTGAESLVLTSDSGDTYAIPLGILEQFKLPPGMAEQFEDPAAEAGEGDREASVAGHWWGGWQSPRIQRPPQTWDFFRGGNVCSTGGYNFWGR